MLTCPYGHRVRPVPIIYGYPMPEGFAAAERGEVVIGGCIVTGDDTDPEWACPVCREPFRVADKNAVLPHDGRRS
jgi:hypothetical protein